MFEHGFPPYWSTLKKLIWLVGSGVAGGAAWRTLTGAIVSFIASKAKPINSLTVTLEPQQDLHGQDAPYPAGGGKNKFDESTVTFGKWIDSSGNVSDIAYGCVSAKIPVSSSNYYLKSFGTSPNTWSIVEYASDNSFIKRSHDGGTYPISVTLDSSTAYIVFQVSCPIAETMTAEILASFKVILVEGSTAPASYSPYSNICPITGVTGASVTRTGKNLVDMSFLAFDDSDYSHSHAMNESGATELVNAVAELIGKTIYYSCETTGTGQPGGQKIGSFRFMHNTTTVISFTPNASKVITTFDPSEITSVIIYGSTLGGSATDFMFNLGDTAEPYEPYTGTTVNVDWETEAGTVYGGTLDVVSGLLTVTQIATVYDGSNDEAWANRGSDTQHEISNANISLYDDAISSMYPVNAVNGWQTLDVGEIGYTSTNRSLFRIKTDSAVSLSDWKTYLSNNPFTLVAKLATPVEYTLTPQQISTLVGQNNVCGDGTVSVTIPSNIIVEGT